MLAALPAAAQRDKGDFAAVRQAMARQEAAWNRGDVEAFMEEYWKSERLEFIGAAGPTYGWQQTLDNYKLRFPDRTAMGELSFDILDLTRRSRTVLSVVGKFHLARTIGDLEGHFLLIWQKIDGKWVIVADCTSS